LLTKAHGALVKHSADPGKLVFLNQRLLWEIEVDSHLPQALELGLAWGFRS
jgi:hypothetical protein